MKNLLSILIISVLIILSTGCSIIDGIFKTGMGIGAFIVIAILIIGFIISRWIKK